MSRKESSMTSLRFRSLVTGGEFRNSERARLMTSTAELLSRTILSTLSRARSKLGGAAASQRRAAGTSATRRQPDAGDARRCKACRPGCGFSTCESSARGRRDEQIAPLPGTELFERSAKIVEDWLVDELGLAIGSEAKNEDGQAIED